MCAYRNWVISLKSFDQKYQNPKFVKFIKAKWLKWPLVARFYTYIFLTQTYRGWPPKIISAVVVFLAVLPQKNISYTHPDSPRTMEFWGRCVFHSNYCHWISHRVSLACQRIRPIYASDVDGVNDHADDVVRQRGYNVAITLSLCTGMWVCITV